MTPDERKMLNDLAEKVSQTPPPPRDPEAEEFIRTHIGNRPDALYLMTQTVLIQNLALQNLQRQVQDLQQRSAAGQVASGSSFLGGTPGSSYQQSSAYSQPAAPPPAAAVPPQYAPPAPASGGGGASSFLRGAAQTATGVAAGTLAAEAIGSLFHPGGGGMFGGSGLYGGGGVAPTEEIVNNYYDAPPQDYRDDRDRFADQNVDDQGQYDDNSQLDDASDTGDDGGYDDDNSSQFDV